MERVTGHWANQSVVKDLTGRILRGEPIAVSDRSVGRDYTYVADIAGGICSVLDAPNPSHFTHNVSAGRWLSLGDIIDALKELRPGIQVVEASPLATTTISRMAAPGLEWTFPDCVTT